MIFGFNNDSLKVLLLKVKDQELWGLPGGFVKTLEDNNTAASRVLKERTGANHILMEQFHVFGDLNRSENFFEDLVQNSWYNQRFLSIGYYALVNFNDVGPLTVDQSSSDCEWKDITDLPGLMMDHKMIFEKALATLRDHMNKRPIGYSLLPEKFTLPELQRLYEVVLEKKFNRGNFYRKIMKFDVLIKLDETRRGGAHKAPDLYSFDLVKYTQNN